MPFVKSGTLTPNVVETVTVDISRFGNANQVGVLNRSNVDGAMMWVRIDGKDPAPEADDSYPVVSYRVFDCQDGDSCVMVKMISSMALKYTVEGGKDGE